MYLEYFDLPRLSDSLIENVYDTIKKNNNIAYSSQGNTDAENYEYFSSITASDELIKFTKSIFDFDHLTHIFFLTGDLPMHVDNLDIRSKAYNYVIESGGGRTNIHNENKEIIESYDIDLHRWHLLDVSQNHSVSIPNPPRILVTVTPKKD